MSVVRVPTAYRPVIRELAKMTDEEFSALVDVVAADKAGWSQGQRVAALTSSLADREKTDARLILEALYSLRSLKELDEGSPESLSREVSKNPDLRLEDEERDRLASRLASLFSSQSLQMLAKAADLQLDHDRTFRNARVITDLRPIFDEKLRVVGAIVIHDLRVEFMNEIGHPQSIHIALDGEDVEALKDALTKALEKSQVLTEHLDVSGLARYRPLED